jgi:hypothetical protein
MSDTQESRSTRWIHLHLKTSSKDLMGGQVVLVAGFLAGVRLMDCNTAASRCGRVHVMSSMLPLVLPPLLSDSCTSSCVNIIKRKHDNRIIPIQTSIVKQPKLHRPKNGKSTSRSTCTVADNASTIDHACFLPYMHRM